MTCEDAIKVLKEVEYARETLENNIRDVYRQHERADLFTYFRDSRLLGGDEENHRIRKKISEKIKEIHNEIHEEVYANKTPVSKPALKANGGLRHRGDLGGLRQPLTQLNKKNVTKNNVNYPTGIAKAKAKPKKTKTKEVKKPPPPVSSKAYDDLVFQHIYGRQPHQPHRHTIRHVNNRSFCSPSSPTRKAPSRQAKTEPAPVKPTFSDVVVQPTNEYCIHVQSHDKPFSIEQNFPNAIPLGKPSRCLSDRLPITTVNEVEESPEGISSPRSPVRSRPAVGKKLSRAGPNVAVINMKANDMSDSGSECTSAKQRIKAKARERMRNRMKLHIQPLPNVDIDTTDPSSLSSTSNISVGPGGNLPHTLDKISMVEENPKGDENKGFQDFISVQDMPGKTANATGIDEEEEEGGELIQQPEISLPGCKTPEDPMGSQQTSNFPPPKFVSQQANVLDILPTRVPTSIEKNVHDWIEKELLARLISQMVEKDQREPVTEFAMEAPTETLDVRDSSDWIDNIIGLQGIQLFVDAGIPVNKDLVRELIRIVVVEYLETLFGYPPPQTIIEPESGDTPVDMVIPTPPQTPLPESSAISTIDAVQTPNQTTCDLSEQSVKDIMEDSLPVYDDEDARSGPVETLQTPEVSVIEEETGVLNRNIRTPDMSLAAEDHSNVLQDDVGTPASSEVSSESMPIPMSDFEFTEKVVSPQPSPAVDDRRLSPTELEVTPPPIVVTKRPPLPALSSLSTPSTTYHSSSTSVGYSTFEGISIGEYMNSASGVSDGSVGELRLPAKHVKGDVMMEKVGHFVDEMNEEKGEVKEDSVVPGEETKKRTLVSKLNVQKKNGGDENLSVGEVNHCGRELKSVGEVSDHSHLDTDDTSFALADNSGIVNVEKRDPMLRLLDKIDSTRGGDDEDFSAVEPSYKSEGEFFAPSILKRNTNGENSVSLGEDIHKSLPSNISDAIKTVPEVSTGQMGDNDSFGSDNNNDPSNDHDNDGDAKNTAGASSGNVIVVQPAEITVNRRIDFSEKRTATEEIDISTNNTYSHIQDISQSEGEVPESDTVGEVYEEMSEVADLEQDNDKVVMVLHLPDVEEDEQNVTDNYDVSRDDISTISEL